MPWLENILHTTCAHVSDAKPQLALGGEALKHDIKLPLICIYPANICDVCAQLKSLSKDEGCHFEGCKYVYTAGCTCMAFLSCQGSWPVHSSHRITPKEYTSLFSL